MYTYETEARVRTKKSQNKYFSRSQTLNLCLSHRDDFFKICSAFDDSLLLHRLTCWKNVLQPTIMERMDAPLVPANLFPSRKIWVATQSCLERGSGQLKDIARLTVGGMVTGEDGEDGEDVQNVCCGASGSIQERGRGLRLWLR